MPSRIPDEVDLGWFMKNRPLVRNLMRYADQHKAAIIVGPTGKIAPGQYSHESKNVLYDLRETETSAVPLPIPAPVLTVTVDDPNQELDVSWTLPETYDALYLERSEDGIAWYPLATLPGTQAAYNDAAVTVGVEEFYRIRGQVGGAYSAYSNIDSGELTAGCTYSLPSDMAAASPFFQGFASVDFSNVNWTGDFNDTVPFGASGYDKHAGNLYMSENGKNLIVRGGGLGAVRVLQRQADDSFTVTTLNQGGGTLIELGYTMSRAGVIAGTIDGDGAVWTSGPGSAPTMHTDLKRISYITPDGLRLFAITNADVAIERTIGGADVIIHDSDTAFSFSACDHCGEAVIVDCDNDVRLYRKVAGVWTHTATLADETGDTGFYPAACGMDGAGTKALGGYQGSDKVFLWDLTGTGTLTATVLPLPADAGGNAAGSQFSTDGSIAVGYYIFTTTGPDNGVYWLASEGFATAHNLGGYFVSQGFSIGIANDGEWCSLDSVVVSADGTHFAARADRVVDAAPDPRTIYYAACPAPT